MGRRRANLYRGCPAGAGHALSLCVGSCAPRVGHDAHRARTSGAGTGQLEQALEHRPGSHFLLAVGRGRSRYRVDLRARWTECRALVKSFSDYMAGVLEVFRRLGAQKDIERTEKSVCQLAVASSQRVPRWMCESQIMDGGDGAVKRLSEFTGPAGPGALAAHTGQTGGRAGRACPARGSNRRAPGQCQHAEASGPGGVQRRSPPQPRLGSHFEEGGGLPGYARTTSWSGVLGAKLIFF